MKFFFVHNALRSCKNSLKLESSWYFSILIRVIAMQFLSKITRKPRKLHFTLNKNLFFKNLQGLLHFPEMAMLRDKLHFCYFN